MEEIKVIDYLGYKIRIKYRDIGRWYEPIEIFNDELEIKEKYFKLTKDDMFVDIGAAYGSYTILALLQGAKVLAFEPNKDIYSLLTENVMLNIDKYAWVKDNPSSVILENVGLGDREEQINYNRRYQTTLLLDDPDSIINISTLDNYVKVCKPTFIKIDTEGMEYKVLLGARETLKSRPKLLIELHNDVPWLRDKLIGYRHKIINLLKEYNYELEFIDYKGTRGFFYCTPSSDTNSNV